MKYIFKEYSMRCKEEFSSYGFKTYKTNHFRIVGDIFQSFNFHNSISNTNCTVEFGIIPLSVEYELNKSSVNPWHLKVFENNYDWFAYDKNNETSIELCINNIIMYMKKYLMPIFEKSVDSKSAYEIICEYDYVFSSNLYERFCLCLKSGHYEKAKLYISEVIKLSSDALKKNKEIFGNNTNQKYIQKMEKRIKKEQMLLDLVENKNYRDIKEWLSSNENRNIIRLNN